MQIIRVTVFQIISVSFYCNRLNRLSIYNLYSISFRILSCCSLNISFTETSHFSMSFSFSYWNITAAKFSDPRFDNYLSVIVHRNSAQYLTNMKKIYRVHHT